MKYKLKEIFDLQMGKTPARNNDKYWNSKDYKWISIADLTSTDKYINNTKEYISQSAVTESGIKIIPANTVVMSFKLSIGKTAILSEDMYSNEAIMAFHDKHVVELLPEYIYYLIKAKNWNGGSNRAVMGQTLNKATLSEIEVDVHTIDEQRKIVELLNLVGKIIYKRNTQLSKLGDILRARFVEMFGDPVRNSKNWNTEKLCSIAPINKYNGDIDTVNGKVWLLNLDMIESCTGNIVDFLYESENRITSSTIKFDENCVLYSKLRPYLNKVVIPERKGYATSELVSMSTEKINKYFLANLLRQDSFVNFSNATSYGAKMPRASMDLIKNFDVINPPAELQNQFSKLVLEVEKSKVEVQRALDEAQLLFDSLMQKYFG